MIAMITSSSIRVNPALLDIPEFDIPELDVRDLNALDLAMAEPSETTEAYRRILWGSIRSRSCNLVEKLYDAPIEGVFRPYDAKALLCGK